MDKLTFDQESLITELKVMIARPRLSRSSGRGWPRDCTSAYRSGLTAKAE